MYIFITEAYILFEVRQKSPVKLMTGRGSRGTFVAIPCLSFR